MIYLYIYIYFILHFDILTFSFLCIPLCWQRVVSKLLESRDVCNVLDQWNAARQFGQRWSQSKAAYHCWPDKSLWPWLSMCRLGPHQVWLRFGQTPGCGTPNRSCKAERQRLSWGWVKWRVMTMTQTCEVKLDCRCSGRWSVQSQTWSVSSFWGHDFSSASRIFEEPSTQAELIVSDEPSILRLEGS